MERDTNKDRFQKVNEMRKTWVEINHFFEGSMEHNWTKWNVTDDGF